jgi:hypothetical protein
VRGCSLSMVGSSATITYTSGSLTRVRPRGKDLSWCNALPAALAVGGAVALAVPVAVGDTVAVPIHTILHRALARRDEVGSDRAQPGRCGRPAAGEGRPPEMRTWSGAELSQFFALIEDNRYDQSVTGATIERLRCRPIRCDAVSEGARSRTTIGVCCRGRRSRRRLDRRERCATCRRTVRYHDYTTCTVATLVRRPSCLSAVRPQRREQIFTEPVGAIGVVSYMWFIVDAT